MEKVEAANLAASDALRQTREANWDKYVDLAERAAGKVKWSEVPGNIWHGIQEGITNTIVQWMLADQNIADIQESRAALTTKIAHDINADIGAATGGSTRRHWAQRSSKPKPCATWPSRPR